MSGRAHAIDDIIESLRIDPLYFTKCSLSVLVFRDMIPIYRKAGLIPKEDK